jgi:hypothetical protein
LSRLKEVEQRLQEDWIKAEPCFFIFPFISPWERRKRKYTKEFQGRPSGGLRKEKNWRQWSTNSPLLLSLLTFVDPAQALQRLG